MSDEQVSELHATTHGDWWILAAACALLIYDRDMHQPNPFFWRGAALPNGYRWERTHNNAPAGSLTIAGQDGVVTMQAIAASPDDMPYWSELVRLLVRLTVNARALRRASVGLTVDALIEEYDRAKAAGAPVTLRQLADDAGISYAYLRKRKSQKDAAKRAENE